jgi:hypothetical protein
VASELVGFPLSPASLRSPSGGPSGLFFDVSILFAVVEAGSAESRRAWQATTEMYEYRLLDFDQRELLVYHWQPGPRFAGPDHPHLHVSAAVSAQRNALERAAIPLDRLHLATALAPLAAVVRMLITEFGVAPQRSDWRLVLERAE